MLALTLIPLLLLPMLMLGFHKTEAELKQGEEEQEAHKG